VSGVGAAPWRQYDRAQPEAMGLVTVCNNVIKAWHLELLYRCCIGLFWHNLARVAFQFL
jgi:hypothetical protein